MKVALVLVAALSLGTYWRETNSHAAAKRGERAYEKKDYPAAIAAYRRAEELAPSAAGAFNLGTAQIAAGDYAQGSTTLGRALNDPALRADAYFNRGNSAMSAKALDHAVQDFVAALKANPQHAGAKRNLEIALARREAQRRSASQQQQQQQGQSQQQKPAPAQGQQKPQPGQMDLDALLRSVQQQEQEELRRMKGPAGEARVGW